MKLEQIKEVYRNSGRSLQKSTRVLFIITLAFAFIHSSFGRDDTKPERETSQEESLNDSLLWINPACSQLPDVVGRKFIKLNNGSLMAFNRDGTTRISRDGGKTWSEPKAILDEPGPGRPQDGLPILTRDGVIVYVYRDTEHMRKFNYWPLITRPEDEAYEIGKARYDLWSIRSLDGGKTWVDRQRLLTEYNGPSMTIIQAKNGNIVFPTHQMIPDPGRNVTSTFVSSDNGKTWSKPVVLARKKGVHLSYSYIFEPEPGTLWLFTSQGNLKLSAREKDLIKY